MKNFSILQKCFTSDQEHIYIYTLDETNWRILDVY